MQFTSFWGICQDLLCKLGIKPGGGYCWVITI